MEHEKTSYLVQYKQLLNNIADITKNSLTVISTVSMLIGATNIFIYFNSLNATYLLSSPIDLVFLMTITSIGFALLIFCLLFSFSLVPFSILLLGNELLDIKKIKENKAFNQTVFFAILSPYISTVCYLTFQSLFPIKDYSGQIWYVSFSLVLYFYITTRIYCTSYSIKFCDINGNLSKWLTYSFYQSLILFITASPILILIQIISESFISSFISDDPNIQILISIILFGFISLICAYFISDGFSKKILKKKITTILSGSFVGSIFIIMTSMFVIVNSSMTIFSIKDMPNQNPIYRFDLAEIENELPRINLLNKQNEHSSSFKIQFNKGNSKGLIYLDYYAVVKFRNLLVLCPKIRSKYNKVKDITEECIDLTGYSYKQVSQNLYSELQ